MQFEMALSEAHVAHVWLVHRLSYTGAIGAFKMGRRQGGPSRTGSRRAHICIDT